MVDASAFTIQSFRVNQSPMVWIHMNECSLDQSLTILMLLSVCVSLFLSRSTVRPRTASLSTDVACKHTIEYWVMRIKDQVCMFNPFIWWQSKASPQTVTSSVLFFLLLVSGCIFNQLWWLYRVFIMHWEERKMSKYIWITFRWVNYFHSKERKNKNLTFICRV